MMKAVVSDGKVSHEVDFVGSPQQTKWAAAQQYWPDLVKSAKTKTPVLNALKCRVVKVEDGTKAKVEKPAPGGSGLGEASGGRS